MVPIWSTQYVRTAKAAGPHSKFINYKFIIPATRRKRQENQASLSYLRLSLRKTKVNSLTTLYSKMPFHAYQEDVRKSLVSGLAGQWGA